MAVGNNNQVEEIVSCIQAMSKIKKHVAPSSVPKNL